MFRNADEKVNLRSVSISGTEPILFRHEKRSSYYCLKPNAEGEEERN